MGKITNAGTPAQSVETKVENIETPAIAPAPEAPKVFIPESDKLTAIRKQRDDVKAKFAGAKTEQIDELMAAVLQLNADEKTEVDALKAAEAKRVAAEAQAKRLKPLADFKLALLKFAQDETNAEAIDALAKAEEVVKNLLLGGVSRGTSTPKATGGGSKPSNGALTEENRKILEMHVANMAGAPTEGPEYKEALSKSRKAIEAAGYAPSTVWHTTDKFIKGIYSL